MRTLKIVFDRSAFHGDQFELLKKSNIEKLSEKKTILIYHTPVFLEETLSLYVRAENRLILHKQFPFILKVG